MSLFRIIVFAVLGYYIFRTIKRLLVGMQAKENIKKNDKSREENIQNKHANKIEDADFEELE